MINYFLLEQLHDSDDTSRAHLLSNFIRELLATLFELKDKFI